MARIAHLTRADEKNPQRGSAIRYEKVKPTADALATQTRETDGEPAEPTDADLGLVTKEELIAASARGGKQRKNAKRK